MGIYKCKVCGNDLPVEENQKICTCSKCKTEQTISLSNNEKVLNALACANILRNNNQFDSAFNLLNELVNEGVNDSEVYFNIALCKYEVTYSLDENGNMVLKVNKENDKSIFEDSDYLKCLMNADPEIVKEYVKQATLINDLKNNNSPSVCTKQNIEENKNEPEIIKNKELKSLIDRMSDFINDEDYDQAVRFSNDVLCKYPDSFSLNLLYNLAIYKVKNIEDITASPKDFIFSNKFKRTVKYGSDEEKKQISKGVEKYLFNYVDNTIIECKNRFDTYNSYLSSTSGVDIGSDKYVLEKIDDYIKNIYLIYRNIDFLKETFNLSDNIDELKEKIIKDLDNSFNGKCFNVLFTHSHGYFCIISYPKTYNEIYDVDMKLIDVEDNEIIETDYAENIDIIDNNNENLDFYCRKDSSNISINDYVKISLPKNDMFNINMVDRFIKTIKRSLKEQILSKHLVFFGNPKETYNTCYYSLIHSKHQLPNIIYIDYRKIVYSVNYERGFISKDLNGNYILFYYNNGFDPVSMNLHFIYKNGAPETINCAISKNGNKVYSNLIPIEIVESFDFNRIKLTIKFGSKINGESEYSVTMSKFIYVNPADYSSKDLDKIKKLIHSFIDKFKCHAIPNSNGQSNTYRIIEKDTKQAAVPVKKEGCYIATCVYGSYDCPEVWALRRYRDNKLGSTWYGKLFIHTYYLLSPAIVKIFGNSNIFKTFWKNRLDKKVSKLKKSGYEDTPYEDKDWR